MKRIGDIFKSLALCMIGLSIHNSIGSIHDLLVSYNSRINNFYKAVLSFQKWIWASSMVKFFGDKNEQPN